MNYISFDLISDDPTVKTIKKICYYSTNEREINQRFSKIKNYSSIKLFLVPINEINHELYYKDNGDYAIYEFFSSVARVGRLINILYLAICPSIQSNIWLN